MGRHDGKSLVISRRGYTAGDPLGYTAPRLHLGSLPTDKGPTMPALKDLVHLSYCSQAQSQIGQADLDRILEASQRNNQRDDITGMLTYSGEVFVQFLEGPSEALGRLMERLHCDPLHSNIIILSEGSEHERILPGWDMELVTRKQAHQVLRDALGDADHYAKVIGLSRLLARLDPDLHRAS